MCRRVTTEQQAEHISVLFIAFMVAAPALPDERCAKAPTGLDPTSPVAQSVPTPSEGLPKLTKQPVEVIDVLETKLR